MYRNSVKYKLIGKINDSFFDNCSYSDDNIFAYKRTHKI